MNRRTRVRIAFASTVPTFLAVAACCLLAAVGSVAWSLLLAVAVSIPVHAAFTYARLGRRLPDAGAAGQDRA
ncbi:hypothetical protein [Streptomyces sp. NRRL F-5126]|uniref:hypothetical protein n=1 Tax=Streptomyces sp. NRRL F-5126 TaxID=1463857 RepID=UPI000566133F|nr:hypothetical protein [Streptomyces sp. NRRL F-5126]